MNRYPGVNIVGYSRMFSETSFNELTLAPCQSSPDIELPDLNDVAVGVKRGPESPACAFRGCDSYLIRR